MQTPQQPTPSPRRIPLGRCLISSSLVALALSFSAPGAGAQGLRFSTEGAGAYFRTEIGPSFFDDGRLTKFGSSVKSDVEFDVGYTLNVAVGYAFNKYLAADFEFGFSGTEIDSAEGLFVNDDTTFYNAPFLANITFSYPIPRTIITPYIGAGAGGTVSVFDTDGFGDGNVAVFGDDSDVVFAWQAFAGVRFELNKQMSLGVGYKYFVSDDTDFSYPPLFPGSGPDFHLGFDSVAVHSVLFLFQMKF